MSQKGSKQQSMLIPRIYPMGWVLKFDPPVIGLLYRRSPKEKKKHLYQIHLNNLIFLQNGEDITRQIFYEHPNFLNPQFIKPDQVYIDQFYPEVLGLVQKLLEYKQQRLREMAEFMEEYDGEGEQGMIQGGYEQEEEEEEDQIDYENLSEEQLYQLYQQQMQQQQIQQGSTQNNNLYFPRHNDANKSF